MTHVLIPLALITTLFVAMFALVSAGTRLGAGRKADGLGAIDGAVFGLMGLLIAFTFGSAAVRFETRRNLIVEEANDIGTAYLRLDLLPADAQPELREAFRRYVDVRLAVYRKLPDLDATQAELSRIQAQFKRVKEERKGKSGGTVQIGIAQENVAAKNPELASTKWESWLQTSKADGFFELWTGTLGELTSKGH